MSSSLVTPCEVAYEASLQGMVLLKNDNNALPLQIGSNLAIIGPMSADPSMYLSSYASATNAWAPSMVEAFREANHGGGVSYAQGSNPV